MRLTCQGAIDAVGRCSLFDVGGPATYGFWIGCGIFGRATGAAIDVCEVEG